MIDLSTPIGKILSTLKEQLKAKGLSYRDVAERMKTSASTIKRYLSGQGVTLEALQALAAVVELDVFSLVVMAQSQDIVRRGLNEAQLAALRRRGPPRTVFFMLNMGWTPTQIAREFNLTDQMDSILARLQTWGLIRRLSGRAVQLLVRPDLEGIAYGQTKELAIESAQEFLRGTDLRTLDIDWICYPLRLSVDAVGELQHLIKRFEIDLRALARRALVPDNHEDQWHRVFLAARRIPKKEILRQP